MTSAPRSPLAKSPRARWLLLASLLLLSVLSFQRLTHDATVWAAGTPLSGSALGTTWSVRLGHPSDRVQRERLEGAIREWLDEVDRRMSTWRPDSELSRFNDHGSTAPFSVSEPLTHVFRIAHETSELTGGAFDVTVAPLVAAWGFGATDRIPAPPPASELADLREAIGFTGVEIDARAGTLRKAAPDLTCDLSAVAKGWAVDGLGELLQARGHADFLIDVGGELLARGQRPDGGRWRVAIERPSPAETVALAPLAPLAPLAIVELTDLALATSGDYRNYYEAEGRWLSHLIDPRSGYPIDHGLASVTVAHSSAARADALATALIVLGPEAGRELAERSGWAAYFVVREAPGDFRTFWTGSFAELLGTNGAPDVRAGGGS